MCCSVSYEVAYLLPVNMTGGIVGCMLGSAAMIMVYNCGAMVGVLSLQMLWTIFSVGPDVLWSLIHYCLRVMEGIVVCVWLGKM